MTAYSLTYQNILLLKIIKNLRIIEVLSYINNWAKKNFKHTLKKLIKKVRL